jgi:hypothetical protein
MWSQAASAEANSINKAWRVFGSNARRTPGRASRGRYCAVSRSCRRTPLRPTSRASTRKGGPSSAVIPAASSCDPRSTKARTSALRPKRLCAFGPDAPNATEDKDGSRHSQPQRRGLVRAVVLADASDAINPRTQGDDHCAEQDKSNAGPHALRSTGCQPGVTRFVRLRPLGLRVDCARWPDISARAGRRPAPLIVCALVGVALTWPAGGGASDVTDSGVVRHSW